MPNPLAVLEYANLYCGSAPTDDTASNHLTLRSVQLPRLEMQYVDHRPGGSPVSIEIDVIQTRMECKFELIGITPQVMELLGRQWWGVGSNDYFIYGHVRNWEDGSAVKAEAYIRGQLGVAEASEFKRGAEPFHMSYAIRGIQAYSFSLNGVAIYGWDFFENFWAVGGFDQNGILREPIKPLQNILNVNLPVFGAGSPPIPPAPASIQPAPVQPAPVPPVEPGPG